MCAYISVYVNMCMYISICMYVCIYIYMCVCTCMCILVVWLECRFLDAEVDGSNPGNSMLFP